jgi:hypothetical protein
VLAFAKASEQTVHGRSVSALRVVSSGEARGERVLVDAAEARQDRDDRHRHHRIVRVAPRRRWQGARGDEPVDHDRMDEEPLAERIADGEAFERQPGSVDGFAI